MDNEHIRTRRGPFRDLMEKFPPRQRTDAWAFWHEALMRANWERGDDASGRDLVTLERGQFVFGREEMAKVLGMSHRTFRTTKEKLENLSELTSKATNRGTVGTIVRYDVFIYSPTQTDQQNDQQPTSNRPATDHSKGSKGSKGSEEMQLQIQDQKLAAVADGSAPAEPPVVAKRVLKAAKPKAPVDPLTNPHVLIARIEADYPSTFLSRPRDDGILKRLLSGRKVSGVSDPQAEAWGCWVRFMDGAADVAMTDYATGDLRRGHDVLAFASNYALLLEQAKGNGKAYGVTRASCPEHGMPAMRREGWAGKLVYKCQLCQFVYRTEALWTQNPQPWEKDLK